MRRLLASLTGVAAVVLLALTAAPGAAATLATALTIYFIDVEGGKAALIVTPSGESFLIDAGFPGEGRFNSTPGDPAKARDAQRVLLAAHDAGLTHIDHMLVSHYHADHFGGVMELAQLIPIREFIDHASPSDAAEARVPGTLALYNDYVKLRSAARHHSAHAGDHFALEDGVNIDVVASDGVVITKPLSGGGTTNPACTSGGIPAQEVTENPQSTAIKLEYGAFSYLDVGDLTGAPLYALACPVNLIGLADVYNIAHHGGADGSDPSLFEAVKPRAAISSNAGRKGAEAATLNTLRNLGIAGWQLHRSQQPGADNMPDGQIANQDTTTTAWLKLSARRDGSFSITNGRTGQTISYPARGTVAAGSPVDTARPSLLGPGKAVPLALHWTRASAEHRANILQSYRGAEARLREVAAPLSRGRWAVIMDADETVLDNSLYFQRQAERGYLGFTYNWPSFIHEAIAPALPGAVPFTNLVHELGGRLVIVTNRAESVCPDTRRNLENAGVKADAVLCRPPGVEDKNPRFAAVQQGGVAGLPALNVVMWVGDNVQDFPGMTQARMRSAPDSAFGEFGRTWWILPNPVYGSWQDNPLPSRP